MTAWFLEAWHGPDFSPPRSKQFLLDPVQSLRLPEWCLENLPSASNRCDASLQCLHFEDMTQPAILEDVVAASEKTSFQALERLR